jgi:hypothetical protein
MLSLEQLQARLTLYLQAEARILGESQEYSISSGPDGRSAKRASLAEVRAEIKSLEQQIARQGARAAGRGRSFTPSPLY